MPCRFDARHDKARADFHYCLTLRRRCRAATLLPIDAHDFSAARPLLRHAMLMRFCHTLRLPLYVLRLLLRERIVFHVAYAAATALICRRAAFRYAILYMPCFTL